MVRADGTLSLSSEGAVRENILVLRPRCQWRNVLPLRGAVAAEPDALSSSNERHVGAKREQRNPQSPCEDVDGERGGT